MRDRIVAALLIVVAILSVFLQVGGHDFVNLDDFDGILENPHFLAGFSLETIGRYCTEPATC